MASLIPPEDLIHYIPGKLKIDSAKRDWKDVIFKGYEYVEQEVAVPLMRDYMIISYKSQGGKMSRRFDGDWESVDVRPGVVSILTRAEISEWRWDAPINVSHIYLSQSVLETVAEDVFERDIRNVEIRDLVGTDDRTLSSILGLLERELTGQTNNNGSRLVVDSLRVHACVHILRKYANIDFKVLDSGCFSKQDKRNIIAYIEENIDQSMSLDSLAKILKLSTFHFARRFTNDFGVPPHSYILRKRIERAITLISYNNMPLKMVAAECGFCDQSHMTRVFRRMTGLTPSGFKN